LEERTTANSLKDTFSFFSLGAILAFSLIGVAIYLIASYQRKTKREKLKEQDKQ
jgi:hypothetical protein